jgi:hypothetical protein
MICKYVFANVDDCVSKGEGVSEEIEVVGISKFIELGWRLFLVGIKC